MSNFISHPPKIIKVSKFDGKTNFDCGPEAFNTLMIMTNNWPYYDLKGIIVVDKS